MDVSYQYLSFFLEDDDKLAHIKAVRNIDYGSDRNWSPPPPPPPPPPHCKILQAVMLKKVGVSKGVASKIIFSTPLLDLPLYPSRWFNNKCFKLAR